MRKTSLSLLLILIWVITACQGGTPAGSGSAAPNAGTVHVIAVESFLADLAQNIAGDQLKVDSLIPLGVDPHAFEPTPQDIARLESSQVIIVNGGGLEAWLEKTLQGIGGQHQVITASEGLASRKPGPNELQPDETAKGQAGVSDPHFWLDPTLAIRYIENIRDGLAKADPGGASTFAQNTEVYSAKLKDLDNWISQQVQKIPAERRLMVTNHEDFGYYADRYGLKIVGTLIPSVSTEASPSAQEVAQLINAIRSNKAPAVFLEVGANPQLAEQVARETGVKVVTDLYTHSLTPANGPAPDYITMMKYDTTQIVTALE